MKRRIVLLLLMCLGWGGVALGTDYYVGGSGASDDNPGTASQPFATIQKAAQLAKTGDVVIVRAGTYRETITPSSNGVTFQSAPGETVVISGLEVIPNTGWTVHNGNIFKKTITLPVDGFASGGITRNTDILANQLFKDGEMQIQARWPDGIKDQNDLFKMDATGNVSTSAWRHYSNFTAATTWPNIPMRPTWLEDNLLSSTFPSGSLVGATVLVQGWYIMSSGTITSHSGGRISWPNGMWGDNANDQQFRRYYALTGQLQFLNQAREFHYQGGTLYYYQPGGGTPSGTIEYKARNWGFDLRGRSNITIQGFHFKGCEPATGNTSTSNCTIDNIRASYMNHNITHRVSAWQGHGIMQHVGTKLIGVNNTVKNSEFSWSASQGVWIGNNGVVQNNLFHHIGYDGMWGCPVAFWGNDNIDNIKVLNNTAYTMGRGFVDNGTTRSASGGGGHIVRSTNHEVAYNNVSDWGKLNQDGAAWYSAGFCNLAGLRIHHNWFFDFVSFRPPNGTLTDGIMAAVYFDMGSGAAVGQEPATVDHNVFWNVGDNGGFASTEVTDLYELPAFQASTKQPTRIYNNTFWGGIKSYVTYQNSSPAVMRNNISRKDLNFNWGRSPTNIANALLSGTNPQFQGGDLVSLKGLFFRLSASSPARNAGVPIPGITDGSVGAPDIGAYEYGGEEWVPGYKPVSVPSAANTRPTVSITAPANNSTYTQGVNVTITANASDNGAVTRVEFFNGSTKIGEDVTSPYSYAWNNIPAGTHTLTARATDNQGATTTSSIVTITVTPSANPVVAITSPVDGATATVGSDVTINANASKTNGTIVKVEFYRNGSTKLGEDTTSPYSFVWNNVPAGSHSITARATDDEEKTATSAAVRISVAAAVAPVTPNPVAPTVSISSPTNNARVASGAAINITTSTTGTISKVEFFNGTTKLGEDATSPYTYSWTNAPVGTHPMTAVANGPNNVKVTSARVNVVVTAPNQGPVVEIISPTSNGSFVPGETITITARSSDTDGTIEKIEFFEGTTKIGESSSSPYTITWNTKDPGTYSLTAVAWDDKGSITTSGAIEIVVTADPGESGEDPLTMGIPRFFSPNGDGNGDLWVWASNEAYNNSSVTVYSRAGEAVYQTQAYNNAWDGRSEGKPLQDGDYYYVVTLSDQSELRGAVRIVR